MDTDARHSRGVVGEDIAARHFQRLGFDVLARRHRTRFGELDLIVASEDTLVFVEVKTRSAGSGHPWHAFTDAKRDQVRRMGAAWLMETPDRRYYPSIRFDAVGIVLDRAGALVSLDHLEAAF